MSTEYLSRYKIPSLPVMNSLEDPFFESTEVDKSKPFRLVYVGSILENAQLSSILDVIYAVQQLSCSDCHIEFHIYCGAYGLRLLPTNLKPPIFLHSLPASDSDFYRCLTYSDCLLLPSNFDSDSIKHVRLSLPAKLHAYMSSRTPILLYGPSGTAQYDYAVSEQWAVVVNKPSQVLCKSSSSPFTPLQHPILVMRIMPTEHIFLITNCNPIGTAFVRFCLV